jgi:hypothetical protein
LLTVFDIFGEWFERPDYEGCLFVSCLLETHDRSGRIGAASSQALETVRSLLRRWAKDADARDPDGLAQKWILLMLGAIVAAQGGDREAAKRARQVAAGLLERDRSGAG